jgi:Domain amino terminal to FKBP-type peptidyl-prolyl isomerase/FKBP-type peptidyl-prolyl cis-trans isomerase
MTIYQGSCLFGKTTLATLLLFFVFFISTVAAATNEEGVKFLAENKDKPGIISLASGLQYKVLKKGRGTSHPTIDSPCSCHYEGKLLNGMTFDSSYERGEPASFRPVQVIKGKTQQPNIFLVIPVGSILFFSTICYYHFHALYKKYEIKYNDRHPRVTNATFLKQDGRKPCS